MMEEYREEVQGGGGSDDTVRRAGAGGWEGWGGRGSLGAGGGGSRRVNQSHVDPLRAVLWTDDLSQTVGPRLAQQLTCNMTKTH